MRCSLGSSTCRMTPTICTRVVCDGTPTSNTLALDDCGFYSSSVMPVDDLLEK